MCKEDGCETKVYARDWCSRHYRRWRRHGDPHKVLNRRLKDDGEGTIRNGYNFISVDGRQRAEHRVVMEQLLGRKLLSHEHVHHKNGARADNRPENLELWSSHHPIGSRVEDLLVWAHEIIDLYDD